jgi:hypothetical protein
MLGPATTPDGKRPNQHTTEHFPPGKSFPPVVRHRYRDMAKIG